MATLPARRVGWQPLSHIKKPPPVRQGFLKTKATLRDAACYFKGDLNILGMPGNDLLSHSVVPSALERFTVEFGMGSSGGVPLKSPGKRRMFLDRTRLPAFTSSVVTQNDLDFLFINSLLK